ncbi:hypothetical protein F5B21DRAFT_518772 [Xylaria acuta]|nr:hypothetical protein F5B21DRAFT_518772 [Xylaria acuta]
MSYATSCVAGTCTVREAFFTQNQTAIQCHVHPYVNKRFVPITITFFILTFIVVLLRLASRVVLQVKFWYDDYFNIVAFVRRSTYCILHLVMFNTLLANNLFRAKTVITWTLAINVLFTFTLFFPIIFQCSPVDYLWLQWDGTHKGRCIDFRTFVWIATCIGIALDFWAVLVAYSLVSRLQLPLKKKIMVSSMFAVGLIAIAVSIARLPHINRFTGTKNPTIDWVPIAIWSALENYIGVICACLPSLPALLKPLSALKIPSGTKKSNHSSAFASQRTQTVERELGSRNYASVYEMTPMYGKPVHEHHKGGKVITGNSSQLYHSFNDLEREIL